MAQKIAVIDTFSVSVTKKAINRTYEIMGMGEALDCSSRRWVLDRGSGGSGARGVHGDRSTQDGLKAAIAWRDDRFKDN